jgi:hypothetical protein
VGERIDHLTPVQVMRARHDDGVQRDRIQHLALVGEAGGAPGPPFR